MENNILELLTDVSIETLIIAIIVFFLTEILKYPIKRITNKFNEEKRKAINSVILLIPILLSVIITILYFGITQSISFSISNIKVIFNSWLVSLSTYTIYERIKLIVLNIKNKTTDKNLNKQVSDDIITLMSKLNTDRCKLEEINQQLSRLNDLKSKEQSLDLFNLFKTNIDIENLNNEKSNLENEIKEVKQQIITK